MNFSLQSSQIRVGFPHIYHHLYFLVVLCKSGEREKEEKSHRGWKERKKEKGRKGRNLPIEIMPHIFPANCKIQTRFQYHS